MGKTKYWDDFELTEEDQQRAIEEEARKAAEEARLLEEAERRKRTLASIALNGIALKYLTRDDYKCDREIVSTAVRQSGTALQFAHESLRRDRDIVLLAVEQDGGALEFADESLRADREIVLAAVRQSGCMYSAHPSHAHTKQFLASARS